MAVKNNRKAAAFMLKNALKHNQNVLKALREIGKVAEDSFSDMRQYMDEESDTVSFHSGYRLTGNFRGIFSNVVHVSASSKDEYIKSLIEDVNHSYNRVKNFNYNKI